MAERSIAGKTIDFDDDGFMTDASQWDATVAEVLAREEGIPALTARHREAIAFIRAEFAARGEAPSLRALKLRGGIPVKEMYELFPKRPAKKSARIAGIAKPEGCV